MKKEIETPPSERLKQNSAYLYKRSAIDSITVIIQSRIFTAKTITAIITMVAKRLKRSVTSYRKPRAHGESMDEEFKLQGAPDKNFNAVDILIDTEKEGVVTREETIIFSKYLRQIKTTEEKKCETREEAKPSSSEIENIPQNEKEWELLLKIIQKENLI